MPHLALPRHFHPDFAYKRVKPRGPVVFTGHGHNIIGYFPVLEGNNNNISRDILSKVELTGNTASELIHPEKGLVTAGGTGDRWNLPQSYFNDLAEGATSTRISFGFRFLSIDGADADHNTLISFDIQGTGSRNAILIRALTDSTLDVGGRSQGADAFQAGTSTLTVSVGVNYHAECLLDYANDTVKTSINGVEWINASVAFGSDIYVGGTPDSIDAVGGSSNSDRLCDANIFYVIIQKNVTGPEIQNDPYQFLSPASPLSYFFPTNTPTGGIYGPLYGPLGGPV